MNRAFLLTMAAMMVVAPMAFATNPVLVAASGGDFTSVQAAITSFASGEANAGETPPYIINIDPAGGPYVEQLSLNHSIASAEVNGEIVIQSSVPGTLAAIEMQLGLGAVNDGLEISRQNFDTTLRDLLLYPSQTAPVFTDEFLKIDDVSGDAGANTITIQNCILTEIDAGGSPQTTTRAGAYLTPAAVGSTRSGFAYLIQHWGDAGENINTVIDNSVFYANAAQVSIRYATDGANSMSINDSAITHGGNALLRMGSGAGTGSIVITGTDQTAGPDNCTFLYMPGGDNHCIWFSGSTAGTPANISGAILADAEGGVSRGISGSGTVDLVIADLLIATPGPNLVDGPNNASTWDRVTAHTVSPGSNAVFLVAGTGSITARDSIFSGAGNKLSGTTPTGGFDVDYCAFVESGPDTITARDDGVIIITYGSNIINNDPVYLSYDPTSASFLDVDSQYYAFANSGGGALAGGGDYIGGTVPVELSIFSTR